MDINQLETVIVVLMENRSFDHTLGYLSLPPNNRYEIEGLRDNVNYLNSFNGTNYSTFELKEQIIEDPPHERHTIGVQIGNVKNEEKICPMDGFVTSYASRQPAPKDLSLVMGYHTAKDVPMYDFLAKHFAICDHWFAPLPTGTQPNRLMAMAGETRIDNNASFLLPEQNLVYDWLNEHQVQWISYYEGLLPFFALMKKWQGKILKDTLLPVFKSHARFRRFKHFEADWQNNSHQLPQVIFIEPEYTDALDNHPNDDHPPTNIKAGQMFIQSIYNTLVSNQERWSKTVMIVTYDEHGGCFDHISPLQIPNNASQSPTYPSFSTTGVRVPAFIVSPFVEPGHVFHEPLDHTSILQFLAERFTPQKAYSPEVEQRQVKLGRILSIFNRQSPRSDVPSPEAFSVPKEPREQKPELSALANQDAFKSAREEMMRSHPDLFPDFVESHDMTMKEAIKLYEISKANVDEIMRQNPELFPDFNKE